MVSSRALLILFTIWTGVLLPSLAVDDAENCRLHAAKKARRNNRLTAEFLEKAFPETQQTKRRGSSVSFSCGHIGIAEGNPRTSPNVELHWFRGNANVLPRGRFNITGCNKIPFIMGTKFSISNVTREDQGNYSCRLWLKGGFPKDPPIFEEFFFLTVEAPTPESPTDHPTVQTEEKTDLKETHIGVIVGCIFGVVILLFVCCLCMRNVGPGFGMWITCKRLLKFSVKKNNPDDSQPGVVFIPGTPEPDMRNMRINDLDASCKRYLQVFPFLSERDVKEIAEQEIQRGRLRCNMEHSMPIILGTGNFGQVYAGTILNAKGTLTPVAVKQLNDGCNTEQLGNFLREVVTLMRAGQHINVISLIATIVLDSLEGTDLDGNAKVERPPIIVMEIATGGNLRKFLHDNRFNFTTCKNTGVSFLPASPKHKVLEMENLISFGYQVARGMEHLSSRNILHRDLAARNVLLTDQLVVKIADFGLSKFMTDEKQYYRVNNQGITPAKWTAPESLWTSKFTVKSDVWSYGVLLWEILTLGDQPYASVPACKLYEYLSAGNRLKRPYLATFEMHEIMLMCWSWDANARPDFAVLVQKMTKILLSVTNQSYIDFTNTRERLPGFSAARDSGLSCSTSFVTETTSCDSACEINYNTSCETVVSVRNPNDESDDDATESPPNSPTLYEIMNPLYEGQVPDTASYINGMTYSSGYKNIS